MRFVLRILVTAAALAVAAWFVGRGIHYGSAWSLLATALVFGFVNAPLFATFLLGMFWRRTTGHGAFFGLLGGTLAAAIFHGLALSEGAEVGIKGGWIATRLNFHSEMGQNFWMAIVAWTACFLLTILISLATKRTKTDEELKGLVYSLTPKPETAHEPWYQQPVVLGVLVLVATLILNIIFW